MAKILCIDDEESIIKIYREILTDLMGHELTTKLDSQEAKDLALSEEFDLIISDYQMPYITGSQLVNEKADLT
jgi:CheY-like chemotaxis protein